MRSLTRVPLVAAAVVLGAGLSLSATAANAASLPGAPVAQVAVQQAENTTAEIPLAGVLNFVGGPGVTIAGKGGIPHATVEVSTGGATVTTTVGDNGFFAVDVPVSLRAITLQSEGNAKIVQIIDGQRSAATVYAVKAGF